MSLKETIQWRKSVKKYINKPIDKKDLETILEAGRLAPSSFGLEPVKVLAINSPKAKKLLEKGMWEANNSRVTTADTILVVLAGNGEYIKNEEWITNRLKRNIPEELIPNYNSILQNSFSDSKDAESFANEQAHIVASFLALQAADLRIGSCIMTGFTAKELTEHLTSIDAFDSTQFHPVVVISLGYFDNHEPNVTFPRIRQEKEEFVKFL